jgi:putative transcriptional regulator
MKRATKAKAKSGAKRDLLSELSEGMKALADTRQGKRTLRTHAVEYKPAPNITPQEPVRVRKNLRISRALFAPYLRTNVRTLETWEQERARPIARAALLINLVKRYPDTVQRPLPSEHRSPFLNPKFAIRNRPLPPAVCRLPPACHPRCPTGSRRTPNGD